MINRLLRIGVAALFALSAPGNAAAAGKPDPLAKDVKASAWVASPEGPIFVEFLADQNVAALRGRMASQPRVGIFQLTSPDDLIRLLVDKRMAFLARPLTDWAGSDLGLGRSRFEARLRDAAARRVSVQASDTTSESAVRGPVRATLQLASFLDQTGRAAEAEAMLRQQQQAMPFKVKDSWRGIEWLQVGLGIASALKARDDYPGAIEQYRLLENRMADGPFAVNATINRAATLAEIGRYAEALATIDAAWARYLAQRATRDGDEVPGSERQFAWIKACALNGLGRTAEARTFLGTLVEDRELEDQQFVLPSDNTLRFRAAMCMKDFATVKALLLRGLKESPMGPRALLWLQPAYVPWSPWKDMIEQARADPDLRAAAAGRMQILPPELTPALNAWRGQP